MAPPYLHDWKRIDPDIRRGMPDHDVAMKWGIPYPTVRHRRARQLHIPVQWDAKCRPKRDIERGTAPGNPYHLKGPAVVVGESIERKKATLREGGIDPERWMSGPAGKNWARIAGHACVSSTP